MGWNSWNSFGQAINEDLIKRQADALLSSGMKGAGYEYVMVDGGWNTPDRAANGDLQVDPVAFSHGMPDLIDYVHLLGLKFGLRQSAGMTDCARKSPGTQSALGETYLDKARHDAALFARWHVDYIMFDLCAFEYPPDVTAAQRREIAKDAFTAIGQALRETGRPIYYGINPFAINNLEVPWLWAPQVTNMWRVSADVSCWDCTGLPPFKRSVVDILDEVGNSDSAAYAAPGRWNDPGMLRVGVDKQIVDGLPMPSKTALSDVQARSHFSMWAMLAAPLVAGNDLMTMSEVTRQVLTNRDVIALDQDPLGAQAKLVHAYSPDGSGGGSLPPAVFRDGWDFRGGHGQQVVGDGDGTAAVLGLSNAVEDTDPVWVPSPGPHSDTATAVVLSFGGNEVVTLPGVDDLDLSQGFAFEAWVYQRSRGRLPRLLERAPGIQFFINANGELQADVGTADGTLVHPRSNESIPLTAWTHIGLRYEVSAARAVVRFFVNGREVTYAATGVLTGDTQLAGQGHRTYVGNGRQGDHGLDGLIAYARIGTPGDALGDWQTGLFPVRAPRQQGPLQVWVKPLANGDRAVALLNKADTSQQVATSVAAVGMPAARQYVLRDLWDQQGTRVTPDAIAATVPPHGVVVYRVHPQDPAATTVVGADNPLLHFEGRWGVSHNRFGTVATTVNSGSRVSFAFNGQRLTGLFDVWTVTDPPQICVSIDGGPPQRYTVDSDKVDFTLEPLPPGQHSVEVAVKDVSRRPNRWHPPMQSRLTLRGFDLDDGRLVPSPGRPRPRMAFFGDSITQGARALGLNGGPDGADGTKTYAYLAASAFNADLDQVGFGRQGILRPGTGGVPPAVSTFDWNFAGSRADQHPATGVVVINHGTNDRIYDSETFRPAYLAYLRQVRHAYPKAWIFAMRPFGGVNLAGVVLDDEAVHAADIKADVETMRDPRIVYVDTTDWLTTDGYTDGVHPNVAGHRQAADRLIPIIHDQTGLPVVNQ